MTRVDRRTRGHRIAGHGPAGTGLRKPAATRWWQWRTRRRLRPGAQTAPEPRRSGRWSAIASAVTSITAVAALLFTGLSLQQTRAQNQLAESGQITDRFNAAVTNLGSFGPQMETVRIGGIYALQRIMQDSPRDQPAVIQTLAAFVREHAPLTSATPTPAPTTRDATADAPTRWPPIDVQTALTVLGSRDARHDQGAPVDLDRTQLIYTHLAGANLIGADLTGANLVGADLTGANLTGADLYAADLGGADFTGADLTGAKLDDVDLTAAVLYKAVLTGAYLGSVTLTDASRADLTGALLAGEPWCGPDGLPARPGGYLCVPRRFRIPRAVGGP